MSFPCPNKNFPFSKEDPTVMVVDVRQLAAKMLKSMTKKRALEVATNIYVNHTVNEADKRNWKNIISILNGTYSTAQYAVSDKMKAKNADYTVPDKLEIGKSYHLSWAHRGCVWKLIEIKPGGVKAVMRTPKTKKTIEVYVKDILNIRNR